MVAAISCAIVVYATLTLGSPAGLPTAESLSLPACGRMRDRACPIIIITSTTTMAVMTPAAGRPVIGIVSDAGPPPAPSSPPPPPRAPPPPPLHGLGQPPTPLVDTCRQEEG